jgi:hypothetical protein
MGKKYIPTSSAERYRRVIAETALINQHYTCFHTRMAGNTLVCRGRIQPTPTSRVFRVEVEYAPWDDPVARVLEPDIPYNPEIHMYKNRNLCLFHWKEQPWERGWHVYDKFIPWLAEWLVFYELYCLTGKWHGRSAVHSEPKVAPVSSAEGGGATAAEVVQVN